MLEAQEVDFYRGARPVLLGLSLKIGAGETVFILGPNGSGKSTLLRLFSGLLQPTHGKVLLRGKLIDSYSPQKLAQIRGVLLQDHTLSFNFKVWEIVGFGLRKTGEKERMELVSDMLHKVKIWNLRNRNYLELSGGEKQRVQLARVMAQVHGGLSGNTYLLLDEPTAHLDEENQAQIMEVAQIYTKAGNTVIAVSHDPLLAKNFATRALFIRRGIVSE